MTSGGRTLDHGTDQGAAGGTSLARVLVVGLAEELAHWLENRLDGVAVCPVSGSHQACRLLDEHAWSLVVVHDAGPEAVERMVERARGSGVPVICFVGPDAGPDEIRRLRDLGARQVLTDPVDREELALHAASAMGRPLRPADGARPGPLRTAIGEIWARHRRSVMDQVATIEQGLDALGDGGIDDERWTAVRRHAHNLAGSLGMFGFSDASALAQQLDEGLRCTDARSPEQAARLIALVASMRRALQSGPR